MSWLLRSLGLVEGDAEAEMTPPELDRLRQILAQEALNYLQAGGVVLPENWLMLSSLERAALTAAGRRLQVEQAVRIGQATQGDLAALRVRGEVDGGLAHDDAALQAAVKGLARARREAHAPGA